MLCPHCSSPRHNLCAPGFRLEVDMIKLADATGDFSAASMDCQHRHLLGLENPPETLPSAEQGKPTPVSAKTNVLIALPVFTDCGLGSYGRALLANRAPQMLQGNKIDLPGFDGSYGQIHLIDLSCEPAMQLSA